MTAQDRSPRLGFPSGPPYAVWAHITPVDGVTKR